MDIQTLFGATFFAGKAGLTGISGGATTYSTSATTHDYCVGGKAYALAQVSGGTTPTTDVDGNAITITASKARIVVWVRSASAIALIAGPVVDLDADGAFVLTPQFPGVDLDTYCPFAYHVLKAGSTLSGTFTVGSSNWNTAGMTHTVVDVMTLPSRPQSS